MKKLILIIGFILLIAPSLTSAALININTADATELDKIPEVGPAIASRIIDYRTANGLFKTIEEIKNVKGIGDATFLKMKDQITVGDASSSDNVGNTGDDNNNSENQGDNDSSGGGDSSESLSAHTGEVGLSNYKKEELKISAGRERLATVRTPISFVASTNKTGESSTSFVWNFGDGTSAYGQKVVHAYQFPGRYKVVLNVSVDQKEEAIARTSVLVSPADIKITDVDVKSGYIEITNKNDKEQNLNNWFLVGDEKKYMFPLDTIISPKTSIKVPLKTIGFGDQGTKQMFLAYPDGEIASSVNIEKGSKIVQLKRQLADLRRQEAEGDPVVKASSDLKAKDDLGEKINSKNVVVLAKEPSWFEKIKHAIFK